MLLAAAPLFATNYTVKPSGGNYTTIQACATAISAGDSCTVYAGTYPENVTVTAGTAGNYKTITVNGTDIVSVLGFTLNSHTKLIGNCPVLQGTVTTATCGFFISNPSSPTTSCATWPNSTTDVYIRGNAMAFCGTIGAAYPTISTYIYIQNNTISYTNVPSIGGISGTCGGSGGTCVGNSILIYGNHYLIENNDLSHYTLSVDHNASYIMGRNNIFHDQHETEAAGNGHTDTWFAEPGVAVNTQFNVYEGNLQRNAFGPNAKSILSQNDTGNPCGSLCNNLIIRYNTTSRIGGAINSNNGGADWPYIKVYNNTNVDSASDTDLSGGGGGINDNSYDSASIMSHAAFLNQVYYLSTAQTAGGSSINMYACGASCNSGYSDYWCVAGCTHIDGNKYGTGNWTDDAGNQNANPSFVNYISAGNASNNYHLQAGSPLIAAGTYLTTVASGDSGSGTSLVVTDASYFQDGYGLTNAYSTVSGDCISVTTVGNHVCVTAVNYSTNTLTLASGFSRSNGDHVWLYSKSDGVQVLTGSAPDLGAYPYNPATPPSPVCPAGCLAAFVRSFLLNAPRPLPHL